jgi:outer membrane protein OmpA-like peptidoglycan-associated protein
MLLSISADEKFAYVAISKSDSNLHDIYLLTLMQQSKPLIDKMDGTILAVHKRGVILPQIEKAVNIEAMDLTVLKGAISDQFTGDPIFANIELTDNATNQVVATFNSNETTGNYLVSLPSGKDYGIAVKAENCLFYSDNLTISNAKGYNEIVKDIQLQRIEVGSKVVLKNIFFATGKATLTESSETELQNLLKLMRDVPSLKIEVSGHTDNVGSASKNKVLSEDRAKAVVDYLLANNIAQDRLIYKGYGFEQPIASNQTKEGRQQNRRTEFKVIAR